jgi:tetratricopeptide (TPR) repeat protein
VVFVESTTVTELAGDSTSGEGNSSSAARVTAERYAAKGSKAMSLKRYVEAADAYGAAAKADPGWYQAHFNHAAAAIEAGRTTEALAACQQALELKPASTEARYNYALALKQAGRYAEAAAQLERVVSADAKNARAHLSLGNLYADQLRQTDKARAHYLSVLEIDPRHPQAGAIHFWLRANPPR